MSPELIEKIFTGAAGLVGVLIGATITTMVNWRLKTKESRLRILEKIFDKRVEAHEKILEISKIMRTTIPTKEKDEESNAITYPTVISTREKLDSFINRYSNLVNSNAYWLDIDLIRELQFIQDYLLTLDMNLEKFNEEKFISIGVIIKPDFVNLAYLLEKQTMKFFEKDILNIKIMTTKKRQKYKRKETESRLNSMCLYTEWGKIEKFK